MTLLLLIAFIGIPIIEIAGFITVGSWIGLWWTLGTVLLTAIVGTALVRSQSTSVLARINEELAVGEIPARALFDGLCLLAAALLLLTPGFFTDAIGIALLLPPVRALIAPLLLRWAPTALHWSGVVRSLKRGMKSWPSLSTIWVKPNMV